MLLYLFFSLFLSLLSLGRSAVGLKDSQPNRILLVTIHHMLYPITVEVLHQVFSPHGFVEKIVTFQKSAGQHPQVISLYISLCLNNTPIFTNWSNGFAVVCLLKKSLFLACSLWIVVHLSIAFNASINKIFFSLSICQGRLLVSLPEFYCSMFCIGFQALIQYQSRQSAIQARSGLQVCYLHSTAYFYARVILPY